MTPQLLILDAPAPAEREAILGLLRGYNRAHAAPAAEATLTVVLRDEEGRTVGGLIGVSAYDWLIVELVFVPEEMRAQGVGTALLARAEEAARARGCKGMWLDTFSFQARGFYEKLGFELFGAVEDHPIGAARYFLKKTLD